MKLILAILIVLISSSSQALLRIAVVDTGYNKNYLKDEVPLCKTGHMDMTGDNNPFLDTFGHGTHVSGTIDSYARGSKYCQVIIKYFSLRQTSIANYSNMMMAILWAVALNVDMVNVSAGGVDSIRIEKDIVLLGLDHNIKFVMAAGNEGSSLRTNPYYPACYDPRITAVGSLNVRGFRLKSSNFTGPETSTNKCGVSEISYELGELVEVKLKDDKVLRMTGTSQATAVKSGKLVKELSK